MNFQSKNVLVSGGAGFIGSELVRQLLEKGSNVRVLDNFASGDMANLAEVEKDIKIFEGDIRDEKLGEIISKNNIDYVFNLAAYPFIPASYEKPLEFFDVDARGVLNIMMASKDSGVKRIMQYSTSEVYGTAKYVPMDENHPTLPCSTYAVSKLAADRLCFTLHHEHNVPVIILRQFNVYGPRLTQPYIVPEIIRQLRSGNRVRLGNINARRDLTYVTDAVKGSLLLMGCDKAVGDVVNIGSGKDWSVKELVEKMGHLMGHKNVEIDIDKQRLRPLDVERLQADYSKMNKLTGWKPQVGLDDGLKMTIDWFKNNGSQWAWERKFLTDKKDWELKENL